MATSNNVLTGRRVGSLGTAGEINTAAMAVRTKTATTAANMALERDTSTFRRAALPDGCAKTVAKTAALYHIRVKKGMAEAMPSRGKCRGAGSELKHVADVGAHIIPGDAQRP